MAKQRSTPRVIRDSRRAIRDSAVAVMFSGGRDSSLAACLHASQGRKIHLINCDNGVSIGRNLVDVRIAEIQSRFPDTNFIVAKIPVYGLFRRIALVDLDADFTKYGQSLIVLGSQLAMHTHAAVYCLEHHIDELCSGFSGYQHHFPEQMPLAVSEMAKFLVEYRIRYETPIKEFASEDDVKYRLFDFGISTKSLEDTSVFSDTGKAPKPELAAQYIRDKLPTCRKLIQSMIPHLQTARSKT
jgi:7-cyano-7-deazaguanine synthase in queuosine biosynthesis